MPVQFTQEGGTSIRVEKNGVFLDGAHAQIHTALARAGREAALGGRVAVVREQRIRVSFAREEPPEPAPTIGTLDGGNASTEHALFRDGGTAQGV